jgi:hypothetical protein
MITATPRQLLCQKTDTVTGWINGFHFWDGSGNVLQPQFFPLSDGNDTVHLDNIPYPWRHTKELPTAYSEIDACNGGDHISELYSKILAGMLAKRVQKGKPEGYVAAMKMAGVLLPQSVTEDHHSILQAQPVWIAHAKSFDVRYCPCNPLCGQVVANGLMRISRAGHVVLRRMELHASVEFDHFLAT